MAQQNDPIEQIRKIVLALRQVTHEYGELKKTTDELYEISYKDAESSFNRARQKTIIQIEKIIRLQTSFQTMLEQAHMSNLLKNTEPPLPSNWSASDDPEQKLEESIATLERLYKETQGIIQEAEL
ncbi:hypothetical protein U27_06586 [Candidatus Vecturithrix granuli]|uniref:Uncharacterized protein n=1 Tax=Vecturithrix granuli TaxID=1499967 RepID=A0A081C4U6_VECG1|nr:hypothetical protein U27_06586 [Candidatus Vecturithrix granuli]